MDLAELHSQLRAGDLDAVARFFAQPTALDAAQRVEKDLAMRPLAAVCVYGALTATARQRTIGDLRRTHGDAAWFVSVDATSLVFGEHVVDADVAFRVAHWFYEGDKKASILALAVQLPRSLAFCMEAVLFRALAMNDIATLELLLQSYTFLEVFIPEYREWLLTRAAQQLVVGRANRDVVNVLIAHGASVDQFRVCSAATDARMHRAVGVQWLVDEGAATVGNRDMFRVENISDGHEFFLREMLRVGADHHPPSDSRWFHVVVTGGRVVLETLLRETMLDVDVDAGDLTLLMLAIIYDREVEIIQLILDHNPDLSRRSRRGRSALSMAAERASEETVRALLARGADTNLEDVERRTPLYYACMSSSPSLEVIYRLLQHGADPLKRDKTANSVVDHLVARSPTSDAVLRILERHLMERGLDVNGDRLSSEHSHRLVNTVRI